MRPKITLYGVLESLVQAVTLLLVIAASFLLFSMGMYYWRMVW